MQHIVGEGGCACMVSGWPPRNRQLFDILLYEGTLDPKASTSGGPNQFQILDMARIEDTLLEDDSMLIDVPPSNDCLNKIDIIINKSITRKKNKTQMDLLMISFLVNLCMLTSQSPYQISTKPSTRIHLFPTPSFPHFELNLVSQLIGIIPMVILTSCANFVKSKLPVSWMMILLFAL